MPTCCIVIGCSNRSNRDFVSFYSVPAVLRHKFQIHLNELSAQRRKYWIAAFKRNNLTESKLRNQKVCSRHFISGKPAALEAINHPDWIPSLHMGVPSDVKKRQRTQIAQKTKIAVVDKIRWCSIRTCQNYGTRTPSQEVSYYNFPTNKELFETWATVCQPNEPVNNESLICSEHFVEEDFEQEEELLNPATKKNLKFTAVPSLLLPEPYLPLEVLKVEASLPGDEIHRTFSETIEAASELQDVFLSENTEIATESVDRIQELKVLNTELTNKNTELLKKINNLRNELDQSKVTIMNLPQEKECSKKQIHTENCIGYFSPYQINLLSKAMKVYKSRTK